MVVALGAHSFAPTSQAASSAPSGLASPGRPGQGAPSATASVWVPPWAAPAPAYEHVPTAEIDPLRPVKVEYVSPSAIETIDLCERKWGFAKLDRLDKGSMAAAELGTATHAQHERWFIDGKPYDLTTREGELALATSDLLPSRDTPGLRVEQEMRFAWPTIPGGLLGGKIDLNWRESYALQGHEVHIVLDHKTSSNVEQYGKLTRDALLHHPQAPVYGAFGIWFSGPVPADEAELRWNYVNTKGKPRGTRSWHVVRPDEVHDAVERYVAPGARRLLQIVEQANESRARGVPFGAKDLPFPDPGKKACTAFGGCPFKSVCGITPAKGIAIMADQSQDFLVRMGLAPAPLAPAPAAVAVAPAPAAVAVAPAPAPAVQNLAVPPPGYAHSAPSMGYGPQINPPEGQLPPPVAAPVTAPAEPAAATTTRKRRTKAEIEAAKAAEAGAPHTGITAPLEAPFEFVSGPTFLEQALLVVLPAVCAHMVPLVLTGQFQPSAVATLALEIAKAASEGVEQ